MKNTKPCRSELPIDVWDGLAALAASNGMTLGAYARQVLTAHVLDAVSDGTVEQPAGDRSIPVTPADWQTLVKWVQKNPERWAEYDGPRDTTSAADRATIFAWYIQQK